jgi:hypothetical protein
MAVPEGFSFARRSVSDIQWKRPMLPIASSKVAGSSAASAPPKQVLFGQPKLNSFIPQGKTSAYFGEKRNECSEPLFLSADAPADEQDGE